MSQRACQDMPRTRIIAPADTLPAGDKATKQAVAVIYMVWLSTILLVQYSHPWTGKPPDSLLQVCV